MGLFLQSKILDNEQEKLEFLKRSKELIGVDFPREYLNQGFVRGFFDNQDKLVGGYALILNGPLRTISSIPHYYQKQVENKDLFEITGFWLDPKLKSGGPSCQFWCQALLDILKQHKKDYMVFSFDSDNDKLRRLYAHGGPITLYEGMVDQLPGMKSKAHEVIQMVRPKTLTLKPLTQINFIFKRLRSGRNPALEQAL